MKTSKLIGCAILLTLASMLAGTTAVAVNIAEPDSLTAEEAAPLLPGPAYSSSAPWFWGWASIKETAALDANQADKLAYPIGWLVSGTSMNCLAQSLWLRCIDGELYVRIWQRGWALDGTVVIDSSVVVTVNADVTKQNAVLDLFGVLITKIRIWATGVGGGQCQYAFK